MKLLLMVLDYVKLEKTSIESDADGTVASDTEEKGEEEEETSEQVKITLSAGMGPNRFQSSSTRGKTSMFI